MASADHRGRLLNAAPLPRYPLTVTAFASFDRRRSYPLPESAAAQVTVAPQASIGDLAPPTPNQPAIEPPR